MVDEQQMRELIEAYKENPAAFEKKLTSLLENSSDEASEIEAIVEEAIAMQYEQIEAETTSQAQEEATKAENTKTPRPEFVQRMKRELEEFKELRELQEIITLLRKARNLRPEQAADLDARISRFFANPNQVPLLNNASGQQAMSKLLLQRYLTTGAGAYPAQAMIEHLPASNVVKQRQEQAFAAYGVVGHTQPLLVAAQQALNSITPATALLAKLLALKPGADEEKQQSISPFNTKPTPFHGK